MLSNSHPSNSEHPLLADRQRLDRILDVMYAKIQKTLFPEHPRQRRPRFGAIQTSDSNDVERILDGTGFSADDILSEALIGLLQYPLARLQTSWEALSITIARNKAIDARMASENGLRGTDHRAELRLVSGDIVQEREDGETEPSIFETTPSNWEDPVTEYFRLEAALKLRDLARELLNARDRRIFFAIHFGQFTRTEVGERLNLTSQRVGQIYKETLLTLQAHIDYPFKPPITVEELKERRNR